jgi:MFS transporter, ACS family, solute carrier family 17 (sodium-dependent inorganic phosphate cotransporter), other
VLWSSVVTLIIPFAANLGVTAMVISRVVLGFLLGASWPAIHPMTAVWIPPMDRSKFISNMMASALGAAITMPICGYLISWFGWPSVFYSTGEFSVNQQVKNVYKISICSTGSVGVLWSLCWFIFVFESPAKHPRISEAERKEIEDAIGKISTCCFDVAST